MKTTKKEKKEYVQGKIDKIKSVLRIARNFSHRITKVVSCGETLKFYTPIPSDRTYVKLITSKERYGEEIVMQIFMSFLKEGWDVWDIGSHTGVYAILAAKKVGHSGKVVAFEPLGENVVKIVKNSRLNGLKNVEVVEAALGKESGVGVLYYFLDPSGKIIDDVSSTLLKPKLEVNFFEKSIIIARGDDFLERYSVPRAIKIDVEGYEYEVIEGMKKVLSSSSCKLVLLEVHVSMLPLARDCDSFEKLFYSFGFNMVRRISNKETFHLICFKNEQ